MPEPNSKPPSETAKGSERKFLATDPDDLGNTIHLKGMNQELSSDSSDSARVL